MPRARLALAAMLVLAVSLPADASAHTLTPSRARAAAQAFLDRENSKYGMTPEQVTGCKRRAAHVVDCAYRRGTGCGTVRVRLKHGSRRTRARYLGYPYKC
jgi:hypothetical protein